MRKTFRFTDDQLRMLEYIKKSLNSDTDTSVIKFLLDLGHEKLFGDKDEKAKLLEELKTIKEDLSKLKKDHKYFLKYLDAITESLTIIDNRNRQYKQEISAELDKNYQSNLEILGKLKKGNT